MEKERFTVPVAGTYKVSRMLTEGSISSFDDIAGEESRGATTVIDLESDPVEQ
jgi:hypothetical protein